MVKNLFFLLLLMFAVSPCFAGDIPFTIEKGYLIIQAKIKKDIPVEVAIATGSPYSTLNGDLILRHKIKLSYTNDGPVTGRNDKIIHFAEVPQIIVGDAPAESLFMKERSFEAINKKVGREIGAILGADFFKGKILQIDFGKKVFRLYEKSVHDYKQLKSATSNTVLLFQMDQIYSTFYGSQLTLPVAAEVTYGGSRIRTLFETGTASPVSISPAAAKEFSIAPVPDKGSTKVVQLKAMSLNGYEIADVPAMVFGKNFGFDENLREFGAIVGLGVLQNFTVTFDWKEKKIVLER